MGEDSYRTGGPHMLSLPPQQGETRPWTREGAGAGSPSNPSSFPKGQVLISASTERPTREQLIARHMPLARRLAKRYRHTSEPLEDLVQVASMGLVMAADRYDPERGVPFTSFAVPTIAGELRRHIRDHAWAARVPRGLQENVLRVTAVSTELSGSLGRSPTPRELAEWTG